MSLPLDVQCVRAVIMGSVLTRPAWPIVWPDLPKLQAVWHKQFACPFLESPTFCVYPNLRVPVLQLLAEGGHSTYLCLRISLVCLHLRQIRLRPFCLQLLCRPWLACRSAKPLETVLPSSTFWLPTSFLRSWAGPAPVLTQRSGCWPLPIPSLQHAPDRFDKLTDAPCTNSAP